MIFKVKDILAGTGKLPPFCWVLVTRTKTTVITIYVLLIKKGGRYYIKLLKVLREHVTNNKIQRFQTQ